ncbi:hypothetical protein GGF45_001025 [Coemansia sp. RSA 551]|nr:hypothetical protein GGF45_001025 [Coemansia sp. RSA 551]KAJ2438212.1 hypothetical protein IWW46_004997 [Coemansia sp. RSA 2440]
MTTDTDPLCSEEEKMLAGKEYDGFDPHLASLRTQTRQRVARLSHMRSSPSQYAAAVRDLLGSVSDDNAVIETPVYFDYGRNTHVGKRFYMHAMCVILDSGRVDIGHDVVLGPGVQVYTPQHPLDLVARATKVVTAPSVRIGNNVRVGGGAIILPGVRIGNGVTVGAGSVVTKDVPNNVVVAGNPARIVKHL